MQREGGGVEELLREKRDEVAEQCREKGMGLRTYAARRGRG